MALHHRLTVDDAEIFCCASSRDQARILFQVRIEVRSRLGGITHPPGREKLGGSSDVRAPGHA
jgi:hypothetical protein